MIRTMSTTFDEAKDFFISGVRHFEAGDYEGARRQFEASLSLVPRRASTLMNLGATLIKLGRFAEAAALLDEAVRIEPTDAQAWGHLATALAELGQHENALASADAALRLDGMLAPVWTLKGSLLRDLGRDADAAPCYRQALAHGGDAELNSYFLAALGQHGAPPAAPRGYVQALFDGYAPGFERHLVEVLQYRAPQLLAEGLGGRRFNAVLDLGCGTGLVAETLRGRAGTITGIDLSSSMVKQALGRGLYSEIHQADVLDFLRATQRRFDLVVAADVFIYLGDLEPVFAAVYEVLDAGGVFAFTVELCTDEEHALLKPSMRYAHSRSLIRTLAAHNGFDVQRLDQQPIRLDQQQPVGGLLAWLIKP